MNTIKLIDTIAHVLTELLYLIAIVLYQAWQYRQLIIFALFMTFMALGGLYVYCLQTSM